MKKIKFQIEGTQPLMLNNNQVVNPFNKYTKMLKPLTAKKKKTEADMTAIQSFAQRNRCNMAITSS